MASNVKIIGKGGKISFVGLCRNGHEIGELFYEDPIQKGSIINNTISNHTILPDGKCVECGKEVFYTSELDCKDVDIERLKLHGIFWSLKKGNFITDELFFLGMESFGNNNFSILCNPITARIMHEGNKKEVRKQHWIELEELRQKGKIEIRGENLQEYLKELEEIMNTFSEYKNMEQAIL